jgi:hypothetical protein
LMPLEPTLEPMLMILAADEGHCGLLRCRSMQVISEYRHIYLFSTPSRVNCSRDSHAN